MKVTIKPRDGVKIRRPDNLEILDAKGEEVEFDSYWARRVNEGDAEIIETEPKKGKK